MSSVSSERWPLEIEDSSSSLASDPELYTPVSSREVMVSVKERSVMAPKQNEPRQKTVLAFCVIHNVSGRKQRKKEESESSSSSTFSQADEQSSTKTLDCESSGQTITISDPDVMFHYRVGKERFRMPSDALFC